MRSGSPRLLGVPGVVSFCCLPVTLWPRPSWCQDAQREIPGCGKRCEGFEHQDITQGKCFGSLSSPAGIWLGFRALCGAAPLPARRRARSARAPQAGPTCRVGARGWGRMWNSPSRLLRVQALPLSTPALVLRAPGREHRVQQSHARPGIAASQPGAGRGEAPRRAVVSRLTPRLSRLGFNLGSLGRAGGGELQLLRLPKPFLSLSLLAFLYLVTADGNFPAWRRDWRAERSLRCSP